MKNSKEVCIHGCKQLGKKVQLSKFWKDGRGVGVTKIGLHMLELCSKHKTKAALHKFLTTCMGLLF
jgi:hypothetical protein